MPWYPGILLALGLLAAPATAEPRHADQARAENPASVVIGYTSAKRHKHRIARAPVHVAPFAAAPVTSGWTGPDPSKGPGEAILRQMQREGRCVIDEGYGRYSSCSNE